MELKHVIPNMEKTFGNLEFAGENKVELLNLFLGDRFKTMIYRNLLTF